MSKKLWGGRFAKSEAPLTEAFNESISFDKRLYDADISVNLAHARMLAAQEIITDEEFEKIQDGLIEIYKEIEDGTVEFKTELEDIHMNIEALLTEKIGEAGKRLHTARSRNDQVATDFLIYVREASQTLREELINFCRELLSVAREHTKTIMPGYTHLQRAQPVSFAHYLLAYVEMFFRDSNRFFTLHLTNDESPLGAGALAGTTYPIDQEMTAAELGFEGLKRNSLDAVSDRDFALEFLFNCAVTMMHLSRLCEEIILYSSAEFNFIELDDAYTTGSSIMPQKKNPDMAELIRGKTGRCYGNLISLLTTMKGLPLAYNKDMQEDKEPVFDSYDTVDMSLKVIREVIKTMKVNKDVMRKACETGFLSATDLADWLVSRGMAFRDAHAVVGELVLYCEKEGKNFEDLTLEELRAHSQLFDSDVYRVTDLDEMVKRRKSYGGPAPENVMENIDLLDFIL